MSTPRKKATQATGSKYTIVNHDIVIRSADRTPKDIADFVSAWKACDKGTAYPNRTRLYDIYDNALNDAHLSGIINKRINTILNKDIQFERNNKGVDAMMAFNDSAYLRGVITEAMWAMFWGMSLLEHIPGGVPMYQCVPRKHIKPEFGVISKEQSMTTGVDYTGMWNMQFIGDKYDLGLLLKCAPLVLLKRGNMADWARYIEQFGSPLRTMTYNPVDVQTKTELRKILDESGNSLSLMIPEGVVFDVKDGKQTNGDGKLQASFQEMLNNEMSVIILGATETTTSNSNSTGYAQSKVHSEQQMQIVKSDMNYVMNVLNSDAFIAILRSYGLPVEGGQFTFSKEFDFEAIGAQVEIINKVKLGGTPVDDDYVYEITGIPKPKDYDSRKKQQDEQREAAKKQQQEVENRMRDFFGNALPPQGW